MLGRRLWLPFAVLLLAGCRDAAAPLFESSVEPQLSLLGVIQGMPSSADQIHILQQSQTAPPLATYQVSFWVYKGKGASVVVNYQPTAGQSSGDPFLQFVIPKNGLLAGAAGAPLNRGDSVQITLTIDPVRFAVDFQPAGLVFAPQFPASLAIWYENANPDLNGDGVVNWLDLVAARNLAFFWNDGDQKIQHWFKLASQVDPTEPHVVTALYHFSEYALSW